MSDVAAELSMFERVGGAVVIDRLVEAFYKRMDTLPEAKVVRAMHAPDLGPVKSVLKRYLSEWTGGPKLYSLKRSPPVAAAAYGLFDRQCRARCLVALHARRACGNGRGRRCPAGTRHRAHQARGLDAQPGRQSS